MRLLAALFVIVALDAHAQLYKCVDEQGKTRYTDKPSADCKATAIKGNPASSGAPERREDLGAEERDFQRRQSEQQASQKKEQQALAQRCARARQERAFLGSGQRIVRIDA